MFLTDRKNQPQGDMGVLLTNQIHGAGESNTAVGPQRTAPIGAEISAAQHGMDGVMKGIIVGSTHADHVHMRL